MKISLILLAAGNSRRFGSNKLLYEIDGKPMYRYVADEIAGLDVGLFAEKIVVSQYDEILEALVLEGWSAVRNTEPELGISRSLQLGIARAEQSADMDAWCFVVADQPYLRAETVEGLVRGFEKTFCAEGKTCACVKYGERMGNPCIFARVHKEELMNLTGDAGGKRVLRGYLGECFLWEVEDALELEDIDDCPR